MVIVGTDEGAGRGGVKSQSPCTGGPGGGLHAQQEQFKQGINPKIEIEECE